MDKVVTKTSLRLPSALYGMLEKAAGDRPMHSEILMRLERSFTQERHSGMAEVMAGLERIERRLDALEASRRAE